MYSIKHHYQKPLLTFIKLLALVLILLLMAGCRSKKPMATERQTINTAVTTNNDLLEQIIKTQPIRDSIIIRFPAVRTSRPDCDSICQEAANNYLNLLNQYKASGKNSYNMLYNEHKRTLELNIEMGETIDYLKQERKDSIYSNSVDTYKEIPVPYVPKFWRYSAYVGWILSILILILITVKVRSWIVKKVTKNYL